MILDYGTQLSPLPIFLNIGAIKKPTLKEIAKLTFERFYLYESFIKMTPELFYKEFTKDEGLKYWDSLTDKEKKEICLYDIIKNDKQLQQLYVEVLDFFFIENIVFREEFFLIFDESFSYEKLNDMSDKELGENAKGIISKETFPQVLKIIQQICCDYDEDENIDEAKFKNKLAKQLIEKMKKGKQKSKKSNTNLTVPNIISAICNKHPSLNYINIWDLTLFQLMDCFNRMQINSVYDIDSTRVSVWGDEKKSFDVSLWYKNEYDKK